MTSEMRDSSGKFVTGIEPWNKGLKGFNPSPETQFKSGDEHTGKNHPSWNGGIQTIKNDCVHVWVGNGVRQRRPKMIWEQHYGKMPDGFVIYHKDGNKHNDQIDNLEAISRSELLKRNQTKNRNGKL